jgi:hypothetical protein
VCFLVEVPPFSAEDVIAEQGAEASDLFVVVAGEVRLESSAKSWRSCNHTGSKVSSVVIGRAATAFAISVDDITRVETALRRCARVARGERASFSAHSDQRSGAARRRVVEPGRERIARRVVTSGKKKKSSA